MNTTPNDPLSYAHQHALLTDAETSAAKSVNLQLDDGSWKMTPAMAREIWSVLSPGEHFEITAINY